MKSKIILVTVLVAIIAFAGPIAQDSQAQAQWVVYSTYAVNGALDLFGVSKADLANWLKCGFGHTWWVCEYQDGTIVYNDFRCYRTFEEVVRHYTDQSNGDCDAFMYGPNGQQIHICYGRGGQGGLRMTNQHGLIVSVRPISG